MKISTARYLELREAIHRVGGLSHDATMRQRWDALHASRYDTRLLYNDGLNDEHIDTALRHITKE